MFEQIEGESKETLLKNLLSYAARTQNKSVEDLASILITEDDKINQDSLDVLLTNHSNHVKSLQGDTAKKFDDGYSKGKKEALMKAEKDLKAKFNLASDAQIEELVDLIVESREEELKSTFESKQITDVDVQNHELYKSLLSNVDTVKSDYETKLAEVERSYRKIETDKQVSSYSNSIIAELNPIFDIDPKRASNQKAFLNSQICQANWSIQDGVPKLVDEQGVLLKNDQGFPIDQKEFITSIVTQYHSLNQSGNHNSITGDGQSGRAVKGMPRDNKEYIEMLRNTSGDEKKQLKDYARKQPWYN